MIPNNTNSNELGTKDIEGEQKNLQCDPKKKVATTPIWLGRPWFYVTGATKL